MSDLDPRPVTEEDYAESGEPFDTSPEADAADAAEQRRDVRPEDASRNRPYVSRDDVDPADAADQEAEVEVDDEDYR
ncbi:MAG: hypothetical protein J2P24_16910 [Streptosporangiales bacterium]|nr:hypothetical protein [Streptosporangiales bacterium]MBO0892384.1 hypothetical protein [Acidothermales bacterium]